jgi:Zn ribbon nucleic-acid-binding protein
VPPKLAPAWIDYRSRLAFLLVVLVGLVLWADGVDVLLRDLSVGDAALHALAAAWLTATAAAVIRYAAVRCPFCGGHFHWTLWVVNPIAHRCLHCGFQKWRDPDAARVLSPR